MTENTPTFSIRSVTDQPPCPTTPIYSSHHIALGVGNHGDALETFAEAMRFPILRI